jgi:uncharacterized membrane protein
MNAPHASLMKPVLLKKALRIPTVLLTLSLTSCVEPMYPVAYNSGSGFNTYTTLPTNYSGNAYFYNGHYYSGGQYQNGSYNYQGRAYPGRYLYDGQHFYGGNHTAYGNSIAARNNRFIR